MLQTFVCVTNDDETEFSCCSSFVDGPNCSAVSSRRFLSLNLGIFGGHPPRIFSQLTINNADCQTCASVTAALHTTHSVLRRTASTGQL
jgi:hypothetical protein